MSLKFAGTDYLAEIMQLKDGYMLTIRQKRSRWFRRRHCKSVGAAQDEMWRYDSRWRIV